MERKPLSELLGELDSLAEESERIARERKALEQRASEVNLRAGATIKAARQSTSVSQSWLSHASGKTQAYVSQIENGTSGATSDTLRGFHQALASAAIEGGTDGQQEGKQGKHADGRSDAQRARNKRTRH